MIESGGKDRDGSERKGSLKRQWKQEHHDSAPEEQFRRGACSDLYHSIWLQWRLWSFVERLWLSVARQSMEKGAQSFPPLDVDCARSVFVNRTLDSHLRKTVVSRLGNWIY
jgi:hypothetical protein